MAISSLLWRNRYMAKFAATNILATTAAALFFAQPVQSATTVLQPHSILLDQANQVSTERVIPVGRGWGGGHGPWGGGQGHWGGGGGMMWRRGGMGGWGHRGWGGGGWGHRGWGGGGWGHRGWGGWGRGGGGGWGHQGLGGAPAFVPRGGGLGGGVAFLWLWLGGWVACLWLWL